jgi:hypothetical protein
LSGTVAAPNEVASDGGATTVSEALAVLPVPPLVEDTVAELFFTPAVVPVTFTENTQLAPAVNVAPDKVIVLEPAVAVIVPPPQVPLTPFGVDTTRPAGNESANPTPVNDDERFGLVSV